MCLINEKKHGICKEWYENGQLCKETPYVNGEIHGSCKEWHKNGQLKLENIYINNIKID